MKNRIEMQNTSKGVMLTFSGPKAEQIFEAFGTYTLPAPFVRLQVNSDTAQGYCEMVRRNFPGYEVEFI